ncbi:MAG: hypothetical protein F6J97_13785 [Leptolyngbya sp. SIO4C1]|nr:hypothetical protein [Leptolyngbya sp. SIO4C1]
MLKAEQDSQAGAQAKAQIKAQIQVQTAAQTTDQSSTFAGASRAAMRLAMSSLLGLFGLASGMLPAQAETTASLPQLSQARKEVPAKSAQISRPVQPLLAQAETLPSDGVYLFGQQALPDQLETAYLVFEAQAGNIVGAFYMPYSSFDCVQGEIQNAQLSLTITDSYSQETYAYALGLEQTVQVASANGGAAMAIEGFHQIDQVSDRDYEILETCQAYYGTEI